jgi:hypothetical protein
LVPLIPYFLNKFHILPLNVLLPFLHIKNITRT